jgi:hypothetical protein
MAKSLSASYRATNVEAVYFDTRLVDDCPSGVLVGEDGTVLAVWLEFYCCHGPNRETCSHGLATPVLVPIVEQLRRGETPIPLMLGVEFKSLDMADTSTRGLSDAWIRKISEDNPTQPQLFTVENKSLARDQDTAALREGDVVLQLNGKLCSRISRLDPVFEEIVEAVIVRAGVEMNTRQPTMVAADLETSHVISFCGAIVQRPHYAVKQRIGKLYSEVYVSGRVAGSPVKMYGLEPGNFITHVDAKPTPDVPTFLSAIISIHDNTCKPIHLG